MKTLLLCLTLLAGVKLANAQKSIHANNPDEKDGLLRSSFAYKDFYPGRVIYTDNSAYEVLLNYNRLAEKMAFIDTDTHDTLAIKSPEKLVAVIIGNDVYQYNKSGYYVVQISKNIDVNLSARLKYKLADVATLGAYGGYSSTTATQSVGSYKNVRPINAANGGLRFKGDEKEIYTLIETYYLSNSENNIVYADKRGFSKMFPQKDRELKEYLATNKIDFLKQEDLEKLLAYAKSLK